MKRPRSSGFSLIEMLVVVSILVFLIGMLMPTYWWARESGRRAVCLSNHHQLTIAHFAWAGDHNGILVEGQPSIPWGGGHFSVHNKSTNTNPRRWPGYERYIVGNRRFMKHGLLGATKYIPSGSFFYCPSWNHPIVKYENAAAVTGNPYGGSTSGGGWWEDLNNMPAGQNWVQTSYHYNSTIGHKMWPNKISKWRSANHDTDRPNIPISADAFSGSDGRDGQGPRSVNSHHLNAYIVSYLDGHASLFTDKQHIIRDIKGGATYHSGNANYKLQTIAWDMFEDAAND